MASDTYWDSILGEVENKENKSYAFIYTNYGFKYQKEVRLTKEMRKKAGKRMISKKYGLGDAYPDIYFTSREYDCVTQLLKGKTIKGIAKLYSLSPRTVEFYIKNMKIKLNCITRDELLEKVSQVQLVQIG